VVYSKKLRTAKDINCRSKVVILQCQLAIKLNSGKFHQSGVLMYWSSQLKLFGSNVKINKDTDLESLQYKNNVRDKSTKQTLKLNHVPTKLNKAASSQIDQTSQTPLTSSQIQIN